MWREDHFVPSEVDARPDWRVAQEAPYHMVPPDTCGHRPSQSFQNTWQFSTSLLRMGTVCHLNVHAASVLYPPVIPATLCFRWCWDTGDSDVHVLNLTTISEQSLADSRLCIVCCVFLRASHKGGGLLTDMCGFS